MLDEAAAGDPPAARERLSALKDLPQLDITDEVAALARALVAALPESPLGMNSRAELLREATEQYLPLALVDEQRNIAQLLATHSELRTETRNQVQNSAPKSTT